MQEVEHVRRVVLGLIAANGRRHGHLLELPFSLASLGDSRARHRAEQLDNQLRMTKPCCLRPGTARRIKEAKLDVKSVEMARWSQCWAPHLTMSLSDAERFHARDRHTITKRGSTNFEQLVAKAVHNNAKGLIAKRIRQQELVEFSRVEQEQQAFRPGAPHRLALMDQEEAYCR